MISTLKLPTVTTALMTHGRLCLCWRVSQILRLGSLYLLHIIFFFFFKIHSQVKHSDLKAQVLYRLEEFEQCYGVYKDLIKSTDDNYDTERMTNLSAVTANMADKSKIVVDCEDTFEQR